LLRYSAAAHVGLLMIEDVSSSYRYCYPNKYCEYLTATFLVAYSNVLDKEFEHHRCDWPCVYDVDALAQLISASIVKPLRRSAWALETGRARTAGD